MWCPGPNYHQMLVFNILHQKPYFCSVLHQIFPKKSAMGNVGAAGSIVFVGPRPNTQRHATPESLRASVHRQILLNGFDCRRSRSPPRGEGGGGGRGAQPVCRCGQVSGTTPGGKRRVGASLPRRMGSQMASHFGPGSTIRKINLKKDNLNHAIMILLN
jgi:hypothetical protein